MEIHEAGLTSSLAAGALWLKLNARRKGIELIITSGLRTRGQQQRLWENRAANRYPVARPGTSDHEKGIAFDAVAVPRKRQRELGHLWQHMGGEWSTRDEVHFVWRQAP